MGSSQHFVSFAHNLFDLAAMPILRSDISDSRMKMFGVIPMHELGKPLSCVNGVVEPFRISRRVLDRLEQRFDKRIVVADSRSRERRNDAEREIERHHRHAFHRIAVVCMQVNALEILPTGNPPEEVAGVRF